MSALAGVAWVAPHTATCAEARSILSHLASRGGREDACTDGAAALAVLVSDTTGDAAVAQPVRFTEPSIVAAFDGRLDNRQALAEALGVEMGSGDAALVAHGYARWGGGVAHHLHGDFALVIWDAREHQVYAARDILGVRPFAYELGPDRIRWASDPHALVRTGASAVNEAFVAETLCGNALTSLDETLFAQVKRLPPAHAMIWRNGVHRTWRYWTPQIDTSCRQRTDADLQEELRTLLAGAVRSRLRARGPVAIMLSGGIDSSVVTAEAARQHTAVRAYSMDMDDPTLSERRYFGAVVERLRMSAATHHAVMPDRDYLQQDAERFLDLPETPGSAMAAPLRAAMRADGCRVVLTGIGGDEWFFGSQLMAADLVASRQWSALLSRFRADRRMADEFRPSHVMRLALWLQFSESQRHHLRRALRRKKTPVWINPRLAARVALEDRLRPHRPAVELPTHESRELYYAANSGLVVAFREANSRIAATHGLEDRHPFHDRALVEFALSLPPGQRLRGAIPKWIVRRAYERDLPAHVVERGPGPDYSFAEAGLIQSLGGRAAVHDAAERLSDWIDVDTVRAMVNTMIADAARHSPTLGRTSWPLWLVLAVDFWNSARLRAAA